MRIPGSTILVTGASSGIGREVVRVAAEMGASRIVCVARRMARLVELKEELSRSAPKTDLRLEQADLSKQAECNSLIERLKEENIDVLVNNAGIGCFGVFDLADPVRIEEMIMTNVLAPVRLTRAFLPPMVKKKRGGILNVSSGFGLSFFPGYAGYVGSKHFITGFTESLRADVSGTGVSVTQVCPGPVATEFGENVSTQMDLSMVKLVEISAKRCARAALHALESNRALVVPGFWVCLLLRIHSIVPRAVMRFLYSFVGRKIRIS